MYNYEYDEVQLYKQLRIYMYTTKVTLTSDLDQEVFVADKSRAATITGVFTEQPPVLGTGDMEWGIAPPPHTLHTHP